MNNHSNAFNFLSFLENSVDPRTGQYTLAIQLPELLGNDLSGPALPLRLSFNPLSDLDSGFGVGWTLVLSQYTPATRMVSLHTGETFKVTGDGGQPAIRERKLDTFHFHADSAERFRIVHKSGLVEHLHSQGPNDQRVALPVRVEAATGHAVTLAYVAGTTRLETLTDDTGLVLLKLSYASGEVRLDLHPGAGPGGTPLASYRMLLDSRGSPARRRPYAIELPTDEKASWRLEYTEVRGLSCLSKVSTPTGAVERIEYLDAGHRYPGDAHPALPRVTRHVIDPGAGQPRMVTRYKYTSNNFLGYGSGITWADNGEDNLYKSTDSAFTYGTVVEYLQVDDDEGNDDKAPVVRTMTSTFNRFHLMTLHVIDQAGHIQETETRYHEQPGKTFDEQPAYFQLPYAVTKRWKLRDDPTKLREEVVLTRFDEHGNSVLESEPAAPKYDANQRIDEASTLATTLFKVRTWYPAAGEPSDEPGAPTPWNCPPDPYGFSRHLRGLTVHPATATGVEQTAKTLRTRYRYATLALVTNSAAPAGLRATQEELVQVNDDEQEISLQVATTCYLHTPDNPFLHGRVDKQTTTLKHEDDTPDITTEIRYFHSRIKDANGAESLIQTRQTFKGHDRLEKTVHNSVSRYTGYDMRREDLNGVHIHYAYDAMGRLISETVAPDTDDEATRQYRYTLPGNPGERPSQSVTDVQQVVTRTWFDGYNRTLSEERQVQSDDGKTRNWHCVYDCQYDSLGRLQSETRHDVLQDDGTRSMTTTFGYDAWGDTSHTTGPDGVTHRRERSPFGSDGDIIRTWQERPAEPEKQRVLMISEFNRQGKPVRETREDLAGKQVGANDYSYDGLGRCVKQVQTLRDPLNEARALDRTQCFVYDVWGRMVERERPNRSVLKRTFAAHTSAELTTHLTLRASAKAPEQTVIKREYDGLDRLAKTTVGTMVDVYRYQGDQIKVHRHERGSGRSSTFGYRLTLNEQPVSIAVNEESEPSLKYAFTRKDSSITSAVNPAGERLYDYTDQGLLRQEQWKATDTANSYSIDYRHSLQGLPLGQSSSDGENTVHEYDELGRLKKTTDGSLVAEFDYDEDGRPCRTLTTDTLSGRKVTAVQTYDDLGRYLERTVALDDGSTHTLKLTWRDDDQLHERSHYCDGAQLLKETFSYDDLDRLTKIDYQGTQLPRNRANREIVMEMYRFNDLDHLTQCQTRFADGAADMAVFTPKTDGSFQLQSVTHTLQPDYPASQTFRYDEDGNMLNDSRGNQLSYDERGRLQEVRSPDNSMSLATYRYDGHDHLIGMRDQSGIEEHRRYQGYRLSRTQREQIVTRYLHGGEHPLGMQRTGVSDEVRLLLSDTSGSVIGEYAVDGVHTAHYSGYGERPDADELQCPFAFNGEIREPGLDCYMLGKGYRVYEPELKCFRSRDSLAPEDAGINPYMYVLGNPVNWQDPTGHLSQRGTELRRDPRPPYTGQPEPEKKKLGFMDFLLPVILGAVLIIATAAAVFTGGLSLAIAAKAAVGLVGVGMMIGSVMIEEGPAKEALSWIGITLATVGIGAMIQSAAAGLKGSAAGKAVGTQTSTGPSVASRSGSVQSRGNVQTTPMSPPGGGSTIPVPPPMPSTSQVVRSSTVRPPAVPAPDYSPLTTPRNSVVPGPSQSTGAMTVTPPLPPVAGAADPSMMANAAIAKLYKMRHVEFRWKTGGKENGGVGTPVAQN